MRHTLGLLCVALAAAATLSTSPAAQGKDGPGAAKPGAPKGMAQEDSGLDAAEFAAADANRDGAITQEEVDYFKEEKARKQVKRTMFETGATLRTYRYRYDRYPAALSDLSSRGLITAIPKDPWGSELRYELADPPVMEPKGKKPAVKVVVPKGSAGTEEKKSFELRSAGRDGVFGNSDDVRLSPFGIRMAPTEAQRAKVLADGGENYDMSCRAWAWEQGYRAWLAVAEKEYDSGARVESFDGVKLPELVFSGGKPVDWFGREISLRSVRGLRAMIASQAGEKIEATVVSEADFVDVLIARTTGESYDYAMREALSATREFFRSQGRLPLTMTEVLSAVPNNRWSRTEMRHLHYMTLNNDSTFVFFSLGDDKKPGGRGSARDTVMYGPDDANSVSPGDESGWYTASDNTKAHVAVRTAAIKRAAAKAAEAAKANAGDGKGAGGGAGGPVVLPPLPPPEDDEALDGEGEPDVELPKDEKPVEGEDAVPDAAPDAAPEAAPAVPPEAPKDDKPAGDAGAGRASRQVAAVVDTLARVALVQAAGAAETKDEAKPAPAEKPAPAPAGPYVLSSQEDLVPNRLYAQHEAVEVGFMVDFEDWQFYRLTEVLNNLGQRAQDFVRTSSPDDQLPCGNIDLPSNKKLRDFLGNDWQNRWDDFGVGGAQDEPAYVVTRLARGDFSNIKSLVVIRIPPPNTTDPIVVYASEDGQVVGPFFAKPEDQPTGWLDAVRACDGPPVRPAVPAETAPADGKGGKDDGPDGDPSDPVPDHDGGEAPKPADKPVGEAGDGPAKRLEEQKKRLEELDKKVEAAKKAAEDAAAAIEKERAAKAAAEKEAAAKEAAKPAK